MIIVLFLYPVLDLAMKSHGEKVLGVYFICFKAEHMGGLTHLFHICILTHVQKREVNLEIINP